ncbi:AcrR family transcriptional regulator [Paenibacillus sp. DS2015]|uniref:TetR/AcrR family transcriptional regulator n=1 Tax=Paenibacillus sp. DS2015 TaxID=3373917 RepID=UPI003D20C867
MNTSKIKRSPGRPKREEHDATIDQTILRTASQLFMDYGYEAVSLQQIAKACGITKASIYYHFESKAKLFTTSVTSMLNLAKMHTLRIMEQDKPLYDRLEQLAEVKLAKPHGDFEMIMREARPTLSAEQLQLIISAEENIHDVLIDSFQQSMDTGEIRPGNALFLAHTFASLITIGNKEITSSLGNLSHNLIELFWNGMK